MRKHAFVLLGAVFITFLMAQPVQASPTSVTYPDREGDLARWFIVVSIDPYNYILGPPIPAKSAIGRVGYCDILEASLMLDEARDAYVFEMTVAGDLPSKGIIPGTSYVIWSFCPQFDEPGPNWDFWNGGDVALEYDGTNYRAIFWDTRPVMQTGNPGDILEIPLDFDIEGPTLSITVPTALFDVDHFYWFFRTVWLGGGYDPYRMKGGPYVMPDINDPEYAVTPYPGYYLPWLPWSTA